MLTVTFAFIVATALLLFFTSTRAIGAVGVFVLLCLSPLVGGLLLIAALAYYLALKRPAYEIIPRGSQPDGRTTRRRNAGVLIATLGVGGALAIAYYDPSSEGTVSRIIDAVRAAPREEIIVLRTPGGLLEVSRIYATEVLDTSVKHRIFGIEIGETIPRIRVPVVYRYHIELAREWRVFRSDGMFTVVVPREQPSLPVAVDFAGMQKDAAGTWILLPFTSEDALNDLERGITARLEQKAMSRDYIDRQREDARETVREFTRKWLVDQTRWKATGYQDIRVLFADESAGAIVPSSG